MTKARGGHSGRTNRIFYTVVLTISLIGAAQAAHGWLGWWLPFAFLAVAAVELGGVALSVHADSRRQLGERALAARILSALVAAGAVAVNLFGHISHPGQAAFFAGMSALGYFVWLIDSAARRRDHLRASGHIDETAPVYGLWQWIREPTVTRRAQDLALAIAAARAAEWAALDRSGSDDEPATPPLGRLASLAEARTQLAAEARRAAIARSLRRKIHSAVDPLTARIAIAVYDVDEIAVRLTAEADYTGLTALIAADLSPDRLASAALADSGNSHDRHLRHHWWRRRRPAIPTGTVGGDADPVAGALRVSERNLSMAELDRVEPAGVTSFPAEPASARQTNLDVTDPRPSSEVVVVADNLTPKDKSPDKDTDPEPASTRGDHESDQAHRSSNEMSPSVGPVPPDQGLGNGDTQEADRPTKMDPRLPIVASVVRENPTLKPAELDKAIAVRLECADRTARRLRGQLRRHGTKLTLAEIDDRLGEQGDVTQAGLESLLDKVA